MKLRGSAFACGAGTIINAIAIWKGAAFALDLKTIAEVEISSRYKGVKGKISGGGDTRLIERCVELVLEKFKQKSGARIKTESEVPIARGLKSSSAAANAAVLATLSALGEELDPLDAVRLGVKAAMDAGVTITGAFDDACASFLGGIVVTNNREIILLKRVEYEAVAVIYVPDKLAFTKDVNVARVKTIAPFIENAFGLVLNEEFEKAMTLNGLLYCSVLGYNPEPIINALESGARAAGLSGKGPAFIALVDESEVESIRSAWQSLRGKIITSKVNNTGAGVLA